MSHLNQSIFQSGSQRELLGILTHPHGDQWKKQPIIVMLNAGLLHRVGPFRLHVKLARDFARAGFASIRVDLSGIGDSPVINTSLHELDRAKHDVKRFIDGLHKKFGTEGFVLLGLCSGADNAHYVALNEPRVKGIIFLDGYAYPNLRYRVNYILSRVLHLQKWKRQLKSPRRFLAQVLSRLISKNEHIETFTRYFPDKEKIHEQQKQLIERKVSSLHVFTGGSYEYFNYQDQFAELFPEYFASQFPEVVFRPDMDHTYSQIAHREELARILTSWTSRHFSQAS